MRPFSECSERFLLCDSKKFPFEVAFSINMAGSACVCRDAGCGKCELDKSEFSAASPHTKERNSLLISLFQTHTRAGGRVKCCKEEEESCDGNVLLFLFPLHRCSRYWRFLFFFLLHTKRCGSGFFSLSQHQLSTFLNNAGVTLGSNEIIGSPREADFCVCVCLARTTSPRCQRLLIN
jgi:hypothetical protein